MIVKKSTRVLIAEDDPISAKMVTRLIENHGYNVVGVAANGKEAVDMASTELPDVILMDVQMPEMDGLTATRIVQKKCPTPVVVLTAYETEEFIEEASNVGASAYLMKPPNAAEIDRAISIALARHGDLMECKRLYRELEAQKKELQKALDEIKTLQGILPICSFCKSIRNDKGYWEEVEDYIHKRSDAQFSHSVCPDCLKTHYPELDEK